MFDVEEALKPGAPLVNDTTGTNYFIYEGHTAGAVRFGDVEAGFARGRSRHRGRYQSLADRARADRDDRLHRRARGNGRFTFHTNTQAMLFTLDNTAIILQTPGHKLHFVGGTVGGGFGGKVDVIVEPIAMLAAMLTGRPVSYVYTREEEMQVSSPRAAERITSRTA